MLNARKGAARLSWVFLDLDGTLLRPDQTISDRVREAVDRLARSVPVSIATGRELLETIRFAEDLGLSAPQICDGGGAIFGMPEGEVLWSLPLEGDVSGQVIDRLKSDGVRFFATHPSGAYSNLEGEIAHLPWVTTDPEDAVGLEFTRIAALRLSREGADALAADLGAQLELNAAVAYLPYNGLWGVDFTHRDANKGLAAARAAATAGLDLEQCAAVGDSFNDLPMLAACGISVAMGNAHPEVAAATAHVVDSVLDDGLAQAIDEVLLPLLEET